MSRKGGNQHVSRNHKLRETEKDLAFALVELQEGRLESALLSVAVATVRLSGVMTVVEMDKVVAETERLVAAVRSKQPIPEVPDLV